MTVAGRRRFINGQIYYSVSFEFEDRDQRQPVVVSFRYTGKTDSEGKHVFDVVGAPPGAQMTLEKGGEGSVLDLKGLVQELNRHAS
jgi:hypothetical protein